MERREPNIVFASYILAFARPFSGYASSKKAEESRRRVMAMTGFTYPWKSPHSDQSFAAYDERKNHEQRPQLRP